MWSPVDQDYGAASRGLTAYNHNLDTSREFYPKVSVYASGATVGNVWTFQVITTRTYDERLNTISAVREAGISVCSGGILGLGESDQDRIALIWEVAKYVCNLLLCSSDLVRVCLNSMPEHPESFPVNALVPIPGTPLEGNEVRSLMRSCHD